MFVRNVRAVPAQPMTFQVCGGKFLISARGLVRQADAALPYIRAWLIAQGAKPGTHTLDNCILRTIRASKLNWSQRHLIGYITVMTEEQHGDAVDQIYSIYAVHFEGTPYEAGAFWELCRDHWTALVPA